MHGRWVEPTHGSTDLHEQVAGFQQAASFSCLLPVPVFGLSEAFPCDARSRSLSVLRAVLSTCGSKWQAVGTDGAQHTAGKPSGSAPQDVLFSPALLHPQCVLHLPQLCRDNLHSPSSLAATPSCLWAKKKKKPLLFKRTHAAIINADPNCANSNHSIALIKTSLVQGTER